MHNAFSIKAPVQASPRFNCFIILDGRSILRLRIRGGLGGNNYLFALQRIIERFKEPLTQSFKSDFDRKIQELRDEGADVCTLFP